MAEDEVVVKKIRPYPFSAQFKKEGHNFTGNVLKVVMHGFLVELGSVVVKVGDHYEVQFEFPGLREFVHAKVKVIKTYDRYQPADSVRAARLAEYHFLNPNEELKKKIKQFLKVIKQTGTDLV